jgi:RNA polymerase sigma-70 factor (ECF subfamily)
VPGTQDHQRDTERRFAALYQAYYRPILAYAVRRAAPGEDAADVVADVFTTAWRRIGEIPEAPADRLWLYGVAQRVVAGRRRSARRLGRLTARLRADHSPRPWIQPARDEPALDEPALDEPARDEPALDEPVLDRDAGGPAGSRDTTSGRVLTALGRLSPGEREALQLVLWDELSHAEAAQVLGCSANAVTIRVHRAKARLRAELAGARPSGAGPSGPGPSGAGPSGAGPSGADRTGPVLDHTPGVPETIPYPARLNRS